MIDTVDDFEQIFTQSLQGMVGRYHPDMSADEIMGFCCDLIKNFDPSIKICVDDNKDPKSGTIAFYHITDHSITLYKNRMINGELPNLIKCLNTTIHECRHAYQKRLDLVKSSPRIKLLLAVFGAKRGYLKNYAIRKIILASYDKLKYPTYRFDWYEMDARSCAVKICKIFIDILPENDSPFDKDILQNYVEFEDLSDQVEDVATEAEAVEFSPLFNYVYDSELKRLFSSKLGFMSKNNFTVLNFLGALSPFANSDAEATVKILTNYGFNGYASIINNDLIFADKIYRNMMKNGSSYQIDFAIKELAYHGKNELDTFRQKYLNINSGVNSKIRSKTLKIIEREKAIVDREFKH